MKRQKRYISFYKLKYRHCIPYISTYGLMCTRNYIQCLKLGLKHIRKGNATFFIIEKICK